MLLFSLGCGPQPIVPNRCTGCVLTPFVPAVAQVDAVGKARAKELIYTARVVRAEEAREIGIVQAVVRRTTIIAGRCCLRGLGLLGRRGHQRLPPPAFRQSPSCPPLGSRG